MKKEQGRLDGELISAKEVAVLHGVHEATVRRACAGGSLTSTVVGGRYVIRYGDARRWQPKQPGRPEGSTTKKKRAGGN
jgi:hypothetical protein